jgi:tungstate transport system substrate-binding protein
VRRPSRPSTVLPFLILVAALLGFGAVAERTLMLATTTSVDATGLLDVLADAFKAETGITLKWIAVGTGAALKQARDGNADVVIAHARKLEDEFLRDGFGVNRRVIARNFFRVVGPPDDPGRVAGAASAAEAFGRIRSTGSAFVSRGDKSGTHARELDLWALAGGPPATAYLETGQGMAETLRVAAERRAYTLTDTATFFGLTSLAGLRPVFENAPELENIYAVMAVDPARIPTARYTEAMAFIAFLTSPRGQRLIGEFRGKSDRPLFEPIAGTPGVDLFK